MQAGVKRRAGPADELRQIRIHDRGEAAVIALAELHAARRIPNMSP